MESECSQLQDELQDSKDQNELLEFRILELEVGARVSFKVSLKQKSHISRDKINLEKCILVIIFILKFIIYFKTKEQKQKGTLSCCAMTFL